MWIYKIYPKILYFVVWVKIRGIIEINYKYNMDHCNIDDGGIYLFHKFPCDVASKNKSFILYCKW